jgi:hypothetical protein
MSGPDQRLEARDQFNPHAVADDARRELVQAQCLVQTLQETVARGAELVRHSHELLARIPDK